MEHSPPTHQSAKLAVLNNQDLLDMIFEYFGGLKADLGPLRLDPFPVALTCKSFLDPALNAIWRSLGSLIPLLKLLGPCFFKAGEVYALRGDISSDDWARFDSYAQRVKYFFAAEPEAGEVVSQAVYFRLSQLRTTPLLPTLRHFGFTSISSLGCGVFLFLLPSLQLVQLSGTSTQHDDLVETFLSALPSEVPKLSCLRIRGELPRSSVASAMKLRYLRSLSLKDMTAPIDSYFIEQIRAHQYLETLDINLDDLELQGDAKTVARGKASAERNQLKTLTITGGSFKAVKRFFGSIGFQPMETLILTLNQPHSDAQGDTDTLISVFKSLSRRWNTLRRVNVTCIPLGRKTDKLYDIVAIITLSTCRNLVHLDLSNYAFLKSLTDVNVRSLTSHWPHMESLDLPFIPRGNQNRPSASSLYHLVTYCPCLKHLRISLDTSIDCLHPTDPRGDHGLQTLVIDDSDVPNSVDIAEHLDYLFPRLESVRGVEGEYAFKWKHVDDILGLCQTVRSYEKAKFMKMHNEAEA